MTAQTDMISQGLARLSAHHRLGNLRIAADRFGRTWSKPVAAAAGRQFLELWPIWAGGGALMVLCALTVDTASVGLARDLPWPVIWFFQWLTDFGKAGWLLIPPGIVCLILLSADWRAIDRRIAAAWTEFGLIVGFAFLSIAGSGILINIFKQLIGRGRPVVFDDLGAFSIAPFQYDYVNASFPSGHATTMGALAVIVAVILPRIRMAAFTFCGLVAASRVIVGAHYPSDVVAGFMIGAAYTWFYVLALAEARIVFSRSPSGTIRARVIAISEELRPRRGFSSGISGLLLAVIGGRTRSNSA